MIPLVASTVATNPSLNGLTVLLVAIEPSAIIISIILQISDKLGLVSCLMFSFVFSFILDFFASCFGVSEVSMLLGVYA